nr:methyltransferase domain-containing protein [uncultured Methanoregula sp.]
MNSDVKKFYDKDSQIYENVRFTTIAGKYCDGVHKEIILNATDSWKNKKILDLCCGTGRFSMEIANAGGEVISVDFSREMLKKTEIKSRTDDFPGVICLVQGTAQNIMIKGNSLDGCICVTAIQLIKEYDAVIKEISRILKPNGFVIMDFPYLFGLYLPLGAVVNITHKAIGKDVYSHSFSLNEIKNAFSNAGLEISEIRGHFYIPANTPEPFFAVLKNIDKFSRDSPLKYLSASLFIKAIKKSDG